MTFLPSVQGLRRVTPATPYRRPRLPFFFSIRRRHTRWTGDWSSDVCSSESARNQREFFESVMIRGCAARTGWDKPRDPVRGMLSKPNRPVGSRGYSGRSALRRRDRIEICLLGAGGNPTDAILLRIGEPHRSAYRYGQALGEAFEIKIEMPECAVWLHQADHRCAVFCEPDARRTRRDSVWSMNSPAIFWRMSKRRSARVTPSFYPVAEFVYCGLPGR